MPLSPVDWQRRFSLQAEWTRQARQYLFQRAGISTPHSVLDVGCGTGAISKEVSTNHGLKIFGLDISYDFLNIAAQQVPNAQFIRGDAHQIPIKGGAFDHTYCHFLLLWVERPLNVIKEMIRVTNPGGAILVLAEPDYGGRIDFPEELTILGEWQQAALRQQGAEPLIGRQLAGLLHQADLQKIEVGVIGAQWISPPSESELRSEWEVIRSDLEYLSLNSEQVQLAESLKQSDLNAWASGERTLFVPTFYALGWVPD